MADFRLELERYRELVRRKDPATMEKRRLASLCPVCGDRLIDGGGHSHRNGGPLREGRGVLGSDLAVSEGGSGVRIPSPDDPPLPELIDGRADG